MNANKRKWNLARICNGRAAPLLLAVALAVMLMGTNTRAQVGTRPPGVTQRQTTTLLSDTALRWTYRLPAASKEYIDMQGPGLSDPVALAVTRDYVVVKLARQLSVRDTLHIMRGLRRTNGDSEWQTETSAEDFTLSPLHSDRVIFLVQEYASPTAVRAVDAATGRALWERGVEPSAAGASSIDKIPRQLIAVLGSVTALIRMDNQQVELAHTETGTRFALFLPADKQVVQQAIATNGATLPVIPFDKSRNFRYVSFQPYLLHLDVPELTPISLAQIAPNWYNGGEIASGSMEIVGSTQSGVIVLYVDDDAGGAGQSGFPKYLVGMDSRGNKRWQFPVRIRQDDHTGEGIRASQLYFPCLLPTQI